MSSLMSIVIDKQTLWLLLALLPVCLGRGPLSQQFPKEDGHVSPTGEDPGDPLFLTPYIESGDIKTGRRMARVQGLPGTSVISHSGFITVNKTYNSNMFFWLFPAQKPVKDAPLLLWLQGGPGGSSLFGLFVENGPFGVDKEIKLFPQKYTWADNYNMVYIDNPVETGFSFTEDDRGLANNEVDVGENLYRCMNQILQLFPEYQNVDFYITGESYAGKYIPALAHRIHSDPANKIQLRGAAIGDGFSDPPVMINAYADFLFQIGLLDENQATYFKKQTDKSRELISEGNYVAALKVWDNLLNADETPYPSYFQNVTGCNNYYNFLQCQSPVEFQYYNSYLARPDVRRVIHVGNLTYNSGSAVEKHLLSDMLRSVKPWLAELMDNYRVLIYTGQLDIIVALPLTEAMLQTVPWGGLDQYKSADRRIWKVRPSDTEVAGYVRQVDDFYQVLVRGGGHILPYDQPLRSYDMIHRFLTNTL